MATVAVSRQCSICEKNAGIFSCEGCKEIFCTKHVVEHRQQLSTRFEELMTEHNLILQQVHDKEQQNELSNKDILCRIDQWEKNMIEKVHEKAEQTRQQLIHSMNNDKLFIDNFQDVKNEICKRYETEDFFEQDLERIKQNIDKIRLEIDKSIQRSKLELHVEETCMLDWSRLIYVKDECITAASSVIHQQSTSKGNDELKSTLQSNQQQTYYPYSLTSDTVPPIQQMIPNNSSNFQPPTYFVPTPIPVVSPYLKSSSSDTNSQRDTPSIFSEAIQQSYKSQLAPSPCMLSSSQSKKKGKNPLLIVDPASHESLSQVSSTSFSDTNRVLPQAASMNDTASSSLSNLSLKTGKKQTQRNFRRLFSDVVIENSKK